MIGFAGLSHLGVVSSVAVAAKGIRVAAYDPNASLCRELNAGQIPFYEPGLRELLADCKSWIRFTDDAAALEQCQLIFFSADIPTDKDNRSDLSYLHMLVEKVIAYASSGTVLVVLSQVPPGFTRRLAAVLRQNHDRRGLELFYQVETLIFGRAVERALHPERFIVGCSDPESPLPAPYLQMLEAFHCPVFCMRYESAELAKISINMLLVSSVSVANTLAELCEVIGADWSEIIPALTSDKRIGPHAYVRPGLGISGGNLERDLATVLALSEQHGTDGGIVSSWVANSRHRKDWTWRTLNKLVLAQDPGARIAVLGLAYKEDTHSTKNSPSLALLSHLKDYSVVVYDPVVSSPDAGIPFKAVSSAMEAVRDADVVCIMTPWGEFRKLSPSDLVKHMRGRWLIDPYRVVDCKAARVAGLRHVTLGVAPEET